jgi:hypothetical protein
LTDDARQSEVIDSVDKASEVASGFIELYGPVAELEVAQRVAMFEAEGNGAAVTAWRKVGDALRRLRPTTAR